MPSRQLPGRTRYTRVLAMDEPEFGANHSYIIESIAPTSDIFGRVNFQKGPIKEHGVNGCHNEDLIQIVLDRLRGFQETEYKCRENAIAITKLEEALHWLGHRTAEREARGVEGTNKV